VRMNEEIFFRTDLSNPKPLSNIAKVDERSSVAQR
jgi:hypothetical protein